MRLCLISHLYPIDADDYKGSFVHGMAVALARRGHEVHVVTPRRPGTRKTEARDGIHIHRHWYWGWNSGIQLGTLRGYPPLLLGSMLAMGLLRAFTISRRFDLQVLQAYWVVPGGLIAAMTGRLTGRPAVATASGSDLNIAARRRIVRPLVRWTLSNLDRLLAQGPEMTRLALELGMDQEKIHEMRVFLGIADQDLNSDEHLQAAPPIAWPCARGKRLLYVGNLTPPKRVDTLLHALKRLTRTDPAVRLAIIGEGEQAESLKRLAAELNISDRVIFVGRLPHEQIHAALRSADVFVHCSDHEGIPTAIGEAMAAGLPVVAAGVGGVPELVREGETGFLVSPDDAEKFANQISRLIAEAAERQRLGAAGKSFAEAHLTEKAVVTQLESVYEELLRQ